MTTTWPAGPESARGTSPEPVPQPDRSARRELRRVQVVWVLLVLNVLTFYVGAPTILPIPSVIGKVITQTALIAALILVLSVNRPVAVRRSVFIFLFTALAAEALVTSFHAEFMLGAVFRASRLLALIAVLWLLTRWWGRRDHLLIKAHVTALWVILGSVIMGALAAPGVAIQDGRLAGAVWPIPPTQVAHYAAVAAGLAVVLWMSGRLRKELTLIAVTVAVPILIFTHTRTALVAMVAGVLIAGLSLFTTRARVRKVFAVGMGVVSVGALTVSSVVATWLARGQDQDEVADLTGRREVWELILSEQRSMLEVIFGYGLSNKSYGGRPIDSNWLATYYDLGLLGVVLSASIVVFLLIAAAFRPRGPDRALALFLIAYCLVASFTETGLSDASPYVLELALAASLLATSAHRRGSP